MKKNKRILVFAKNLDGGTGTFLSQFVKVKKKANIKTMRILILKKPQFLSLGPIVEKDTVYYPGRQPHKDYYDVSADTMFTLVHEIQWFIREVDDFCPDAIVALDTHCCLFTAALTQLWYRNIHAILTFHNNISAVTFYKLSPPVRQLLRVLCSLFFNRADHIISISRGAADAIQRYFLLRKPVLHIPYGLDLVTAKALGNKDVEPQDKALFTNAKISIISIGRFAPQKDFVTLLRAFRLVLKKIPSARLFLLGDGEEKRKLLSLAQKLGVERAVVFLGWKKNVYPYIRRSSVFVLSSNYEGFSYAIIEAMAQGVPVVSTDTPYGPSEILDGGRFGMLVPMHNSPKMSEAILEILAKKSTRRRFSRLSSNRAVNFLEEKMLKKYKEILEEQPAI